MSFKLPVGVRDYFKGIDETGDVRPKFDSLFDKYYLALMVGLDRRRLGKTDEIEPDDFIRTYPQAYEGYADVIAGLLIDAELERNGVVVEDQAAVERNVVRLLAPLSATRLSDAGQELLNLYAAAGFSIIREDIYPPDELSNFLIAYSSMWTRH